MRYAGMVIKFVSLVLFAVLFGLFLRYAVSFGKDGNAADLTKCNILMAVMILVLITSAISSLVFDFYERNRQQNEQIFSALNQKITNLLKLEDRINHITTIYAQNMELLHNDLAKKVAENTAKFEEYMTQFASLSVQVFAKDKQSQNMQHFETKKTPSDVSGDYFNHYTAEEAIVDEEPEVLSLANKVEIVTEPEITSPKIMTEPNFDESAENITDIEDLAPTENASSRNLIDDILNSQEVNKNEAQQTAEDQLSTIFNDELADTLAGLEIMKDDEKSEPDEIDLSAYFSDEEKIKL